MTTPSPTPAAILRRFNKIDKLKSQLFETERALKADIKEYAFAQGLKIIPRPETLRLGL